MKVLWIIILDLFFVFSVNAQKDVSCARFFEMMNNRNSLVILDVRIKEKYAENRIPGAIYAGEKKILLEEMEPINKEIPVLIYCDYGERSETVVNILEKEGFKEIFHLEEGFEAWCKNEFPVDNTKIELE